MITSIVTGCAGFIGSHLVEQLLSLGHQVIGIDCFTDYYSRELKRQNLATALQHSNFKLIEQDILDLDCQALLSQAEFLFHLAAQAGVRASWGSSFRHYSRNNIDATQVLLEAARRAPRLRRFIFASTSSIYGDAESYPTAETLCPKPVSPYGITKLAAERLGQIYYQNFAVPFVALRYFTVYGPRQRPDMGFHKFIKAILAHQPIQVYSDGEQTRDFTFVADIVAANVQAALTDQPVEGEIINVGGGSRVVLNDVFALLGTLMSEPVVLQYTPSQAGDARHTAADISKARQLLGYAPCFDLTAGLQQEIEWFTKFQPE